MNPREEALLRELACAAIRRGLADGRPPPVPPALPPALARPAAVFVTLSRGTTLRGCVGALEARYPLGEAVGRAAFDAAFRDPRFAPVAAAELAFLDLEISILGAFEEIAFAADADLLAQLERGVHGLFIEQGRRRATFLPKVWESVAEPALFLALLKEKAGLSPFAPLAGARAWRYTAEIVGAARVGDADSAACPAPKAL